MHCKPNHILPAVVHPTKCCVNNTFTNNIVPHIHPTHTTTVNHVNYEHQHFFPHTQSSETVVTNTQANMALLQLHSQLHLLFLKWEELHLQQLVNSSQVKLVCLECLVDFHSENDKEKTQGAF